MWRWLKSIEWAHLPHAGGLMDQEEGLMEDIFTLQWVYETVKAQYEANVAARQKIITI